MLERFRLVTSGKLTNSNEEPVNRAQITNYLIKVMKLPPVAIERVFSGQPTALAQNLKWPLAIKLRHHLKTLGLVTAVTLQLNKECLKVGLKTRQTIQTDSQKATGFFTFDHQQLSPALFSPAKKTQVTGSKKKAIYVITNFRLRWNIMVMFIIGMICALSIETFLLKVLSVSITSNIAITMIAITIFVALIYLFPKLCQSPQLITFRRYDSGDNLIAEERFSLSPNAKHYLIRNQTDEIQGQVTRLRHEAYYEDLKGTQRFSFDATILAEEHAKDLANDVSKEFIENTWLGVVITTYHTMIRFMTSHKKSKNKRDLPPEGGKPVFDRDGKHIANISCAKPFGVYIKNDNLTLEEHHQLILFSWLCAGKFVL